MAVRVGAAQEAAVTAAAAMEEARVVVVAWQEFPMEHWVDRPVVEEMVGEGRALVWRA